MSEVVVAQEPFVRGAAWIRKFLSPLGVQVGWSWSQMGGFKKTKGQH